MPRGDDRAGRDYTARLAMQHVLNTLRLDQVLTVRLLAGMTDAELEDLHRNVSALRERVEQHMTMRGIQV
jgi:hypothetical protein